MAAAVATFGAFRSPARRRTEMVEMACFVVLRPFAPRPFGCFLAPTASTDFSQALTGEISLGQGPRLSARVAGLYRVRL
jgi:hypothetical protein